MLEIQYKSIDSLIPYANNARTHSPEQVQKIASSIKEFGFTSPILIDGDNGIIAGHGRLMASRLLNIDKVPTIQLDGLTDAQKRAYILADNRIALDSGWDNELLAIEFDALKELDFDFTLTGFEPLELKDIILDGAELDGMPDLKDGDKEPFQQKTFTLHDEQASIVDDAMIKARTNPLIDTGLNENSNGNALAYICDQWLNGKR